MMEARNDIEELEALRKDCIAKRNSYVARCEQANGLFGDTQADGGGLFPDQDMRSTSWAMGQIADLNEQIRRIDARLAALRQARQDNTTQTEIAFIL